MRANVLPKYNIWTNSASSSTYAPHAAAIVLVPFVLRITRELERFARAYEGGKRPKLAFCTPPQMTYGQAEHYCLCMWEGLW